MSIILMGFFWVRFCMFVSAARWALRPSRATFFPSKYLPATEHNCGDPHIIQVELWFFNSRAATCALSVFQIKRDNIFKIKYIFFKRNVLYMIINLMHSLLLYYSDTAMESTDSLGYQYN